MWYSSYTGAQLYVPHEGLVAYLGRLPHPSEAPTGMIFTSRGETLNGCTLHIPRVSVSELMIVTYGHAINYSDISWR